MTNIQDFKFEELIELEQRRKAKIAALKFITESNMIEGIHREPLDSELREHNRFLALKKVTIADLEKFVSIYQSDAVLRDKVGLDVRVGTYYPPKGGPDILSELSGLLKHCNNSKLRYSPFEAHKIYESLHPFTDGNGRSGRILWLWMMKQENKTIYQSFLQTWYYQSLSE